MAQTQQVFISGSPTSSVWSSRNPDSVCPDLFNTCFLLLSGPSFFLLPYRMSEWDLGGHVDCSVSWARSREADVTSTDIPGVKLVTWPPQHVKRWVPVNPERRMVWSCCRSDITPAPGLLGRPKASAEGTLSKLSGE